MATSAPCTSSRSSLGKGSAIPQLAQKGFDGALQKLMADGPEKFVRPYWPGVTLTLIFA